MDACFKVWCVCVQLYEFCVYVVIVCVYVVDKHYCACTLIYECNCVHKNMYANF